MSTIRDHEDCPYREYRRGVAGSGSNVPGFARGAYFPGDEPGHYCAHTGYSCEDAPDLLDCPRMLHPEMSLLCPFCREEGKESPLMTDTETGDQACPVCGAYADEYSEDEEAA